MPDKNPLARLEAYSDGIFAIASTLLVLEIKVPAVAPDAPLGELWRRLADLWPSYLAFVLSFGSILVMWVNHHNSLRILQRTSKPFLYANGLLLLTITFIPFPTAVLARYIDTRFAGVATASYAGYAVFTNFAYWIWAATMRGPVYLVRPDVPRAELTALERRTWAGVPAYLVTGIVAWWLPSVGLGLLVALWGFWIMLSVGSTVET